jgi:predicted ester cyclase
MSDTNKEVAHELYRRLSEGDISVVDELISDDFVEHESVPGLEPTKAGVRQMFEMLLTAFEGASFEPERLIGEGGMVVALARMTGVHKAEFMGIAPSGRTINVGMADQFRVVDGKVVEHWGVMDTGALMQQLTGSAG